MPVDLSDILTETFRLVKADASVVEDLRTSPVSDGLCVIIRPEIDFEEGDTLERALPSGRTEQFEILEVRYFSEIHGLPAHYQLNVRNVRNREPAPAPSTVTYNLHGPNSRVNHHSTDRSSNVVHAQANGDVLGEVEAALTAVIEDAVTLHELRAHLAAMRATQGQPAFAAHYAQFMALAAGHLGAITPMLPALANLLVP